MSILARECRLRYLFLMHTTQAKIPKTKMRASDPAISLFSEPIPPQMSLKPVRDKNKYRRVSHNNFQMRYKSLVFISFQGCPLFFRPTLSNMHMWDFIPKYTFSYLF